MSLRVCQWDFVTYPEWHISSKIVSLRKNLRHFFPKWQVWAEKCVTSGKIALNFPEVTQFWEIWVTQGMSRNLTDIPWVTNFPLMTQRFSAKKCVTQGMSTVLCLQKYCVVSFFTWLFCRDFYSQKGTTVIIMNYGILQLFGKI